MKGLFDNARLMVEVDGAVFDVALKPRHALAIQEHFAGQPDVVSMRQTLYSAWLVLNEDGRFPGTLDEFVAAVDNIAVPEPDGDDDPKV